MIETSLFISIFIIILEICKANVAIQQFGIGNRAFTADVYKVRRIYDTLTLSYTGCLFLFIILSKSMHSGYLASHSMRPFRPIHLPGNTLSSHCQTGET